MFADAGRILEAVIGRAEPGRVTLAEAGRVKLADAGLKFALSDATTGPFGIRPAADRSLLSEAARATAYLCWGAEWSGAADEGRFALSRSRRS